MLNEKTIYPYWPFRITSDVELFMDDSDIPQDTENMEFLARHKMMSASICSNLPEFDEARCLVSNRDCAELIDRSVSYIEAIQTKASTIMIDCFLCPLAILHEAIHTHPRNIRRSLQSGWVFITWYLLRSQSVLPQITV